MDDETLGEIDIEESRLRSVTRIAAGIDTISLGNSTQREVDGGDMAEWFSQVAGIEHVESLVLAPTSRLADLRVVKGFPNLRNLQVNSLQIATFDGLKWFRNGRYLNIDTGRNRRRCIAKITEAPIVKMSLQYAREDDLAAIAGCSTLRHLELGGPPRLAFEDWHAVPLEILGLSRSGIRVLADTAQLSTLKKMTLIGCQRLESVTGDNRVVTWLAVRNCSRLDLQTLTTFTNLESLIVVGGPPRPVALSAFAGLKRLRFLSIENRPVEIDVTNLQNLMPLIETLHITSLKADQARNLSRLNEAVVISTARESFRKGISPASG